MGAIVRGVLAWVVGAVVAVGVGMLALGRIGYGLPADSVQPLDSRSADLRPVLSPGSATGTPAASATTSRAPGMTRPPGSGRSPARPRRSPTMTPPAERTLGSAGGSAIVRCDGAVAYLVSWSPEQGYHVDDVRRGPAAVVSVRFEGKEDHKIVLSARCAGGTPQARVGDEDEDDE